MSLTHSLTHSFARSRSLAPPRTDIPAALVVLRKLAMECVFGPLAEQLGVKGSGEGDSLKFRQQGWVLVYYSVAFTWGLAEIWNSPYWMDVGALWEGYPHTRSMTASFKLYFVCQIAFWLQMVFVTLVEPWRERDSPSFYILA
jgi:acyl-CoA-dependent ceramide synthase